MLNRYFLPFQIIHVLKRNKKILFKNILSYSVCKYLSHLLVHLKKEFYNIFIRNSLETQCNNYPIQITPMKKLFKTVSN